MAGAIGYIHILAAVLTPLVALIGIGVAWQQLSINRGRLRHELFDRRWVQFEALNEFIAEIVKFGTTTRKDYAKYMRHTRGAEFLFDDRIGGYLNDVGERALGLIRLDERKREPEANYPEIESERLESLAWFHKQINTTETMFARFMRLGS